MKYYSTRSDISASAPEAVYRGLAADGGLYTPETFADKQLDVASLLNKCAVEISTEVMKRLIGDFSADEMAALIKSSYAGKFETEDLTPVVKVEDAYILELFRGPTSAFKDVALSVLPRLMTASRTKLGMEDDILILTATSGDTGKAALEGFRDVPGTRIIVFYPDGGVSDVQHAQMATQEGDNVRVCAVRGNFDDCQTGVKRIFSDESSNGWAKGNGVQLSSANSINLGRLAPQVAYYFKSYVDLVNSEEIKLGDTVNFVVPTGNFGDILAGEFARRMGLPVGMLICASNANNVLTDFINTGRYDRKRPFHKTISPSMDILVSSNLERYLYLLYGNDSAKVAEFMKQLSETGVYEIAGKELTEMQEHFAAYCATDTEAQETIREVWENSHYLLDPHTAVAWCAMRKWKGNGHKTVVLSTASPYKFSDAVLMALGKEDSTSGFESMRRLNALTGVPIPANLANLEGKAIRFKDVIDADEMKTYVQNTLKA